MYYRRKILLSLLQVFGGELSKIDLQKYLFLFNRERSESAYDFVPYKYGCYSFQSNQDLSTLSKYKLVEETVKNWLLIDDTNYLAQLKTNDQIKLMAFYNKFKSLSGKDLVKYVYENYPYYAINSKIASQILDSEEYESVFSCKPVQDDYTLFTIGYEGKSVEAYTNQLIKANVKVLCDVRKNPLSMKYGFSKNQLKNILEGVGINYLHFPELGIESGKRQELNSMEDYLKLFKDYEEKTLPSKDDELEKLYNVFLKYKRIALTCFEADHRYCHRSKTSEALIKKFKRDYTVKHI